VQVLSEKRQVGKRSLCLCSLLFFPLLGLSFSINADLLRTPMVHEITVHELKAKRDASASIILLDVREPDEVSLVALPGSVHIPMGEIPGRLHELDPDKEIIVYCHHGVRSLHVAQFLAQRDFENVASLAGGIDAWAIAIEPGMPRY
jgi:rhodanese-related sulfurtransferase